MPACRCRAVDLLARCCVAGNDVVLLLDRGQWNLSLFDDGWLNFGIGPERYLALTFGRTNALADDRRANATSSARAASPTLTRIRRSANDRPLGWTL